MLKIVLEDKNFLEKTLVLHLLSLIYPNFIRVDPIWIRISNTGLVWWYGMERVLVLNSWRSGWRSWSRGRRAGGGPTPWQRTSGSSWPPGGQFCGSKYTVQYLDSDHEICPIRIRIQGFANNFEEEKKIQYNFTEIQFLLQFFFITKRTNVT